MATEQQVLTLTTEFNDQASAAIAGVRQAIDQLSGPAVREAQRRVNQEMGEWEKAVRNLGREALGVGRAFGDLVKVIGPFPVAAGLAGYEITRIIRSSAEWSRGVVEMSNAAKMAGLSFGEFKGISEQMQRMGLTAREASAGIAGFNRAYAEVLTSGGKRAEIMSLAGMGYAQNMAQVLLNLRGITDETDRLNAVRQAGENVYQNAVNDTHDTVIARYRERQFLAKFNAEFLINIHRDLNKEDVKRMQARDELSTKARELNEAMTEEAQTREEINEKWNEFLAGPELKMIQLLIDIEKNILARMEQTAPAFGVGPAAPARPGQTNTPGPSEWSWGSAFGMGKPASAPSAAPLPPPQGLADQLGLGTLGGPAAGPATGAAKFYGFTDAGNGGGSIADNWRQSENVEDDRSGQFDQNTNEVRRLNDNLQRILTLTKPGGGLAGQLGLGNISSLGGGGGGGGGYRGTTGTTGTDGTSPTTPPPPPVTGPTGTPLAAVTGGQPFGINVSPERFSQITGLPPSFMNVTAGQRAYARGISTGMGPGGVGVRDAKFVGGKPAADWPTTAAPGSGGGFGATGTVTGTGASISGRTSIAELEKNSQAQAAIARFAAANPNVTDAKTQLYSLVAGESGFGRDMSPGRKYSGYFQMGQEETFAATGQRISGAQLAAMPFDQQLDIYTKWVHHASPNATNLGLFNAASNPAFQTASDDTVVYHAGTRAAQQNAKTWGANSPGGPGGDITVGGIKKYYSRGDTETNRQIAAAGTPAATTAVTFAGTGGPQVTETLPSGAQVIRGAATTAAVTGVNPLLTGINPTTGGSIDKTVLQQAALIAGSTGSHQAVYNFIKSQGLTYTSGENCAEFVTAVLSKGEGLAPGQLPAGVKSDYPAAASYTHYGDAVDALHAQPGDVLARHDAGGSHAMIVGPDGYDPKTGTLNILSANNDANLHIKVGPNGKLPGYYGNFRIGHLNIGPPKTATTAQAAVSSTGLPTDPFAWPSGASETAADSIRRMNATAYGGDKGMTLPSTDILPKKDDVLTGSRWDTGDVEADRATIDQTAQAARIKQQARIHLKIAHKNAPADVSAKADGDAFKGHTMERTNAPPPEAPTKFKAGGLEFA
jgi:hypothetical protein